MCCVSSYMHVDCWGGGVTIEIRDLLWTMVCTTMNLQYMYLVASESFPVSTPSFFSHEVKKKREGAWKVYSREGVISAGSVRGFVECSDLAAPHELYAETNKTVKSLEHAILRVQRLSWLKEQTSG